MSTLSLSNMPPKNARPVKLGRISMRLFSKKHNSKHCKTFGCSHFTQHKHCSGCKAGLPKKKATFHKKLGCMVNIMTRYSAENVGDTVLETLKNVRASSKNVLFKAKDVVKFFQGHYEFSSLTYAPSLMSPADKILIRVVDYWNLHSENGFNSTVQCYWNPGDFDFYAARDDTLYSIRARLFEKRSLKKTLGPAHEIFSILWQQLLKSKGPVPKPSLVFNSI